jgi:hypothetical protein
MRVTKSRRMRWAGHVARMGEMRVVYNILLRKPQGDLGVDRKVIILDWILGFRERRGIC